MKGTNGGTIPAEALEPNQTTAAPTAKAAWNVSVNAARGMILDARINGYMVVRCRLTSPPDMRTTAEPGNPSVRHKEPININGNPLVRHKELRRIRLTK